NASALFVDLGGVFVHPQQDVRIGLLIKDVGFVFNRFSSDNSQDIPLDIRAEVAFKPEHMPFRFILTAINLMPGQTVDLSVTGQSFTAGHLLKYLNFGGEILIHHNFQGLLGYNFIRRYEMTPVYPVRGAGLSFGFRLKQKGMYFEYGNAKFNAGTMRHHFSWGLALDRIFKQLEKSKD
ncbi:MAG: hypothetical protein OEX02_16375, partial [Cyclobacteriaceae bacterium]|nr:hypothetical protein [Cyclobacteriaceae bacterium]